MAVSRLQTHIHTLKSHYPWIRTPLIVGAPMKTIAGPRLAVAVSEAGGIGFIGPGDKPEQLAQTLDEASALVKDSKQFLSYLQTSDGNKKPSLPIGIGFQTWAGDLPLSVKILKERTPPAAIWLFAPRHGQSELDTWSSSLREVAPASKIWIQVASVADAVAAAKSKHRPDVLVIQGTDAGGHSLTKGAGIVALVPEAVDAVSEIAPDIPIIAAGGIADARGVAASLTLGASGATIGTRLLCSHEARINPGYQRHIVQASDGGQNTVRTQLYNHLRGTMDWPEPFDARGLVNESWRDHEQGVPFEENKKRYKEAMGKGEKGWGEDGRMATYAGTGIGLVRSIESAGDIVRSVRGGVEGIFKGASAHL